MPEDEFVPCHPNCWTCKPGPHVSGSPMRWQPTDEPNPFGPPATLGSRPSNVIVDEVTPPAAKPLPRPVPRRPRLAGLIRRLLP